MLKSVYILTMSCLCLFYVLSMSCLCLVFALSMSCLCLVYVLSMSCLCLVYVLSISCLCLCIMIVNAQKDLKKVTSPKFFFARLCRYNDPTFYENKKSHFTIPLRLNDNINILLLVTFPCTLGLSSADKEINQKRYTHILTNISNILNIA